MWAALMLSSLWLVAAAAAQNTCSPVVKVERRNPLDPGNGYAWPDMYAGTWLQPTKRFVRFEPRKIGNIEGAVHAHVYGGPTGLMPTPVLTRDFFDFRWSTSVTSLRWLLGNRGKIPSSGTSLGD